MRYFTLGLLLALTLSLAPPAAADGGPPVGTVPGVGVLELVWSVLDSLGVFDATLAERPAPQIGPEAEPGGIDDAPPEEVAEPPAKIGPEAEPNG